MNVFVKPDEKVIIMPPVYFPFRLVPQGNGRQVVFNPLKRVEGGSYEIDFENLSRVADDKCRLLLLSNPHNPAGICWSRETLIRLATIAIIAAFQNGEEWRRQLISYIEDNVRFVEDYFKTNIPSIKPLRPQATFLVWLDCRDLHLDHKGLIDLFVKKARLALNDGETFGPGGEGFMRLNVGAPRAVLRKALDQLSAAVRA